MDSQSLLNGLKDLFASLGAKTSDSNYAVGLFDKTTKEPKGVMGMSDLASVLGAISKSKIINQSVSSQTIDGLKQGILDCYNTNFGASSEYGIITLKGGGGQSAAIIAPNGYNYFAVIILSYSVGLQAYKYSISSSWVNLLN